MLLRKLWLLTPLLFSLSGCGPKGPTITDCISSPKTQNMHCYDYSTGKNLVKTLPQVDGWVCLSPVDEKNLLMSCASKANGPNVNLCIYDFPSNDFVCFNQNSQKANSISFVNSENYICVSSSDYEALLTYCAQKKAGIIP